MTWWLPVDRTFSTALPISRGDMNCPFLMFTVLPVRPQANSRSVCRARNAGTCSTSTTAPAAAACSTSCTSVSAGTPTSSLTRRSTASPSVSPGPRKLEPADRFALSKLALNMYASPSSRQRSRMNWAIDRHCSADSMTHGPAMMNRGALSDRVSSASVMALPQ